MPGPKTREEARHWLRDAMTRSNYSFARHLHERQAERQIVGDELLWVLRHPQTITEREDMPRQGGTPWRVTGTTSSGRTQLAIGVELFIDERGRAALICTVLPPRRR